jgi:hypothetical protein
MKQTHSVGRLQSISVLKHVVYIEPLSFKIVKKVVLTHSSFGAHWKYRARNYIRVTKAEHEIL